MASRNHTKNITIITQSDGKYMYQCSYCSKHDFCLSIVKGVKVYFCCHDCNTANCCIGCGAGNGGGLCNHCLSQRLYK